MNIDELAKYSPGLLEAALKIANAREDKGRKFLAQRNARAAAVPRWVEKVKHYLAGGDWRAEIPPVNTRGWDVTDHVLWVEEHGYWIGLPEIKEEAHEAE